MKKLLSFGTVLSVMLLPLVTFAQSFDTDNEFSNFFEAVTSFIQDIIIPLLVALAFFVFLWGLVQFFVNSNNESKRDDGKGLMLWGIVGFVIIVSVWGIVALIANGLGFAGGNQPSLPDAPEGGSGGWFSG